MKKLSYCLYVILIPIALGSSTGNPSGGNSPHLTSGSLKPLPASDQMQLNAAPRIRVDDSLRDQGKVSSVNWSGYAATAATPTAGTVTYVAGSWKVPSVTGSAGQYSAIWVGIDGFDDGTVEQLGTMQAVVSSGRRGTAAEYYAWIEMYPAGMIELPGIVKPGDSMTASVSYTGNNEFFLSISDTTQGWNYTTTDPSTTAEEMSAEWVVEAPSSQFGVLPLADFGTVNFTKCSAEVSGTTGTISALNWDEMTMVTSNGRTVKAQPSALSSDGSSFSVTWNHD